VSDRKECCEIFFPDNSKTSRFQCDSKSDAQAESDATKARESKVAVEWFETQCVEIAFSQVQVLQVCSNQKVQSMFRPTKETSMTHVESEQDHSFSLCHISCYSSAASSSAVVPTA